ncbi:MAG: hypothetical protein AAFN41_01255, partial [Planctomycetota bacterium]
MNMHTTHSVVAATRLVLGTVSAAAVFAAAASAAQSIPVEAVLQPTDAAEDNFFGSDIALVDGVLYVGAPGRVNGGTSGTGAVYAFDAVTLAELNTYIASNTAPTPEPSFFGTSIAVEGTNLLVGSSEPDPSDPDKAGAAYLIDLAAGAQVHRFTQTMGDFGTRTRDFGDEVALKSAQVGGAVE